MNFTYRPTPISAKTAFMAVAFGLIVGAVQATIRLKFILR